MDASRAGRMLGSLRARLTFANVMASVAVFVALGGASYAAVSIPRNSVGSKQVRPHALKRSDLATGSVGARQLRKRSVTASKVANKGVTKRSLSSWIRGQLRRRAATGPQGPAGPAGPRGPGAVAARYSATAGTTPAFKTVLDTPGLTLRASCDIGADPNNPNNPNLVTILNLNARSSEAATIYETIAADSGTDPANSQGPADTANLQLTVPAGGASPTGGPTAEDGFSRVAVQGIYASASRTLELHLFLLVTNAPNGDTGSCSINGVIVPA
jgi:hypothetical protein